MSGLDGLEPFFLPTLVTMKRRDVNTRLLLLAFLAFVTLMPWKGADLQAAPAERASQVRFVGMHPVAKSQGGGYCYLEFPHIHRYVPDQIELYQQIDGEYIFVGDPVPFGYEGPKSSWYGHHPVVLAVDRDATVPRPPIFCFIPGPHYHEYGVARGPDYEIQDDAIFYVGVIPPEVVRVRPRMEKVYEAAYRPYVKMRPTVVVTTPPPRWEGTIWVISTGPRAVVSGPRVVVDTPNVVVVSPGIHVGGPTMVIGGPTVYHVDDHHDHHGKHGKQKKHHDNGKHKGWHKEKH